MERTEFTYQRFNLRMGLSLLVFPLVEMIRSLVAKRFEIDFGRYIVLGIVMTLISLLLYYKCTENLSVFLKKGYYWEEDGTVYIQRGRKVRAITNVNWLRGTDTFSYYGSVPMLVVQCGKKKTLLHGKTTMDKVDFSRMELYPIYKLILENNPNLEKYEDFPYWYEGK